MKGNRERINVAEAVRLMIKQIAAPLQILSGTEVLLRARHAVVGSINFHGVGRATAVHCTSLEGVKNASVHHIGKYQTIMNYRMV